MAVPAQPVNLLPNETFLDFRPALAAHCLPKPGYYGEAGQGAAECPSGAACCQCAPGSFETLDKGLQKLEEIDGFLYDNYCQCVSGAVPYPYPLNGFVRSEAEGYADEILPCPVTSTCIGALAVYGAQELDLVRDPQSRLAMLTELDESRTAPLTSGRCQSGYTGRLCMSCEDGYFSTNGICLACPKEYSAKLGFTLCALAAVVFAWVFLGVYMAGTYESLGILLMYLQLGSMLQGFSVNWPKAVRDWALVQQIVNFDVDLISPQCVLKSYGYQWSYYLQLFIPIFVSVANAALYQLERYRILRSADGLAVKNKNLEEAFNAKVAAVTSFQEIVYHSLCIRCFQPWICSTMGNNLHFLVAAPDIECWQGPHIAMLATSILTGIVYVVGIPVLFASVLYYGYIKGLLMEEGFFQKFGWMYSSYEMKWMWWTLMILLRRLLCAAILVFFPSEPFFQSTLAIMMITGATVAHFFARPYINTLFDIMESTALLNLCFLVISGMVFYNETRSGHILGWTICFFLVLAAQMSLGVAIFYVDVYNARCSAKAERAIESKLKVAGVTFDKRFESYRKVLQGLVVGNSGGVSLAQISAILEKVDDSIPSNLKSVNAAKLFHQAQSVEALSSAGAAVTRTPLQTDQVFGAADPGSGAASVAIDAVIQSVAIDYIEELMKCGMRELCRLFRHIDQDANGALSPSEVQPLWDAGMLKRASPELKKFTLQCFFLLSGSDCELQMEEIHRAIGMFAQGELSILKMLGSLEAEAASKLQGLIASTVKTLGKAGALVDVDKHEDPEEKPSVRCSYQQRGRSIIIAANRLLSEAPKANFTSAETMRSVMEGLLNLFKPVTLQVWLSGCIDF
ncbi:hypothetical protein CYMTET_53644 [Cymbomonas tetramitiformis]|uniref:DUF7630 domain-containing protein n=1 Tax=Cymbomonas tetramitiformis TaxID=36881 RepID=A0AAE0EQ53_9CHLO|nr:hypothetical protein CYMTET_53644 [Cymbomonas tetramitiformis]